VTVKYRRLYRHRKGLATVVSTAIMLSAVVLLGTMIVAWSNSNLITKQQEMQTSFVTNINRIKEDLVIEHIWYDAPYSTLNITMNNVGTIGLNVTEIKLCGDCTTVTKSVKITKFNAPMLSGQNLSLNITGYNPTSFESLDIFVTTQRGSIFRAQEGPPY